MMNFSLYDDTMRKINIKSKIKVFLVFILLGFFSIICGCIGDNQVNAAEIKLENFSHNESYSAFDEFISEITFFVNNSGEKPVNYVKLIVEVNDQDENELCDKEIYISDYLSSGENASEKAIVYYEKNDTSLYFNVTVEWEGGSNQYSDSFILEDITANVELINFTHIEHIEFEEFLVSTVTFTLENTGQETANNVDLYVKASNQDNNIQYEDEISVVGELEYGENVKKEIPIDYDIIDQFLNLDIIIKWDNDQNQYFESIFLSIV
jgi:hypothetical protein